MHVLFFKLNLVFLYYMFTGFHIYSHHHKKNVSVEVCQYLIEQIATYMGYLNNVITANNTWIYCYDPMFKQLISEWVPWGSSRTIKPRTIKLEIKYMVVTFFDWEGLI